MGYSSKCNNKFSKLLCKFFLTLIGALFDVRDITILNSNVNQLNISVLTVNVGNAPTDLTLVWNLTRVDTGQTLDTGEDTFAVSSTPVIRYASPSTTYVGQVKITFIGYYFKHKKQGHMIYLALLLLQLIIIPEAIILEMAEILVLLAEAEVAVPLQVMLKIP